MKTKLRNLILSGLSLLVVGCQTGQPVKSTAVDNGGFIGLWNTYAHCQSATDLDQLKQDASRLVSAANRSQTQDSFVLPLPGKIERMVATPSARLAVDVKAMAASCSLRAGHVAMDLKQFDVARPLLESVLAYQSQPDYAYYSLQAKAMLSELNNTIVQVSLRLP
jgi:hypothetical protein